MADPEPSPDTRVLQAARLALARRQRTIIASTHGNGDKSVTQWLHEINGTPAPGLASNIIGTLCRVNTDPPKLFYFQSDNLSKERIEAGLLHARSGAGDQVPTTAAEAIRWMTPILTTLVDQAKKEADALESALSEARPLIASTVGLTA